MNEFEARFPTLYAVAKMSIEDSGGCAVPRAGYRVAADDVEMLERAERAVAALRGKTAAEAVPGLSDWPGSEGDALEMLAIGDLDIQNALSESLEGVKEGEVDEVLNGLFDGAIGLRVFEK